MATLKGVQIQPPDNGKKPEGESSRPENAREKKKAVISQGK